MQFTHKGYIFAAGLTLQVQLSVGLSLIERTMSNHFECEVGFIAIR